MQLRSYQTGLIRDISESWARGNQNLAVVSPTGSGKTVTFCEIVRGAAGASVVTAHRREIVGQISCALARRGVRHRVIAPAPTISMIRGKHFELFNKSFIDPDALVGAASVQTLTSAATLRDSGVRRWLQAVRLAVFDEGHHYVRHGVWARAVDLVAHSHKLFFTACPERADGTGMGDGHGGFCHDLVVGPTTGELIAAGHLCGFDWAAPPSSLRFTDIPVGKTGEFNAKALRQRARARHGKITGDMYDLFMRHARDRRTLVFTTDVETAQEMAELFRQRGINAAAVHGGSEDSFRTQVDRDYATGRLQVVFNVDLFDEGYDVPETDCVIMGRQTLSRNKFLQQAGRSFRLKKDGQKALILDAVGNWEHHGMPDWDIRWSLEGAPKRQGAGLEQLRACLGCSMPYRRVLTACPYCGEAYAPAGTSTLEQVDGNLELLDRSRFNHLVAAYREANMTPDKFAESLIARNIPEIGRPRLQKRHESALYQRRRLRRLMAWWARLQPKERSTAEKEQRFYLRFGVDKLSAFTLPSKETAELIDRITEHFEEDLR